jgi:hypothetical protein
MAVTREEFDQWKEHPVTKRLLRQIQIDVDNMKDMLTDVGLEDLRELQGRCKASVNLLLVEYEDLFNE